jgi:glucosamine-6-phosphate deaminase
VHLSVHPNPDLANAAAADRLAAILTQPGTRNLMVAGGNSPLDLYHRIAQRQLPLGHLHIFVLDEYVGVPEADPRTCANLLRRTVAQAWGVPGSQFFPLATAPDRALASARKQELALVQRGGLDIVVLGLGRNGHLGFNEPGSLPDSSARIVPLEPLSIEANRQWFSGDHAPAVGVTHGLGTLLAARQVILLAYGPHKTDAVRAATSPPPTAHCPASFLQTHPSVWLFLDSDASPIPCGQP